MYRNIKFLLLFFCINSGINNHNAIKKVRELFNELRSNISREEKKRIREKLYKKEAVYNFLKEKDGLTDKEKIVLKNIAKYLKKLNNDLKNYINIKIMLCMT